MRKLKLQIQISVDGFVGSTGGELDWLINDWDDALKNYVTELTEPVDTILLGRKLAEGFIPTWNFLAQSPENAADAGVRKMVDTPKIVFSKSITQHDWTNTVVNSGDLVEEIYKLKQAPGGDMIVYGGGGLVASLIRHGLIDELHLFVNPIALGGGMPIFNHLAKRQPLHLVKSVAFECGIVVLNYTLKKHHH